MRCIPYRHAAFRRADLSKYLPNDTAAVILAGEGGCRRVQEEEEEECSSSSSSAYSVGSDPLLDEIPCRIPLVIPLTTREPRNFATHHAYPRTFFRKKSKFLNGRIKVNYFSQLIWDHD